MSPLYVSVSVFAPTGRVEVMYAAWPEPFSAVVGKRVVPPLVNVTVPVGTTPLPLPPTVIVNVTELP